MLKSAVAANPRPIAKPEALLRAALALNAISHTMVSNGCHAPGAEPTECRMARVFPEARSSLKEADPEIYGMIEDEKKRQW